MKVQNDILKATDSNRSVNFLLLDLSVAFDILSIIRFCYQDYRIVSVLGTIPIPEYY